MPVKTIQQLDEDNKVTAVVYDHSNAKLVRKKTKVRTCRKEAFLSALPYTCMRASSCHQYAENKLSASSTRKQKCRSLNERIPINAKQKLQFRVRTHLPLASKTLNFELDPETSVSFLKELIHRKFGVPSQNQRLYIRTYIQLCDFLTLDENGVGKDEIISLCSSTDDLIQDGSKDTCQPRGKAEGHRPEGLQRGEAKLEQNKQAGQPVAEDQTQGKDPASDSEGPEVPRCVRQKLQIFVRNPLLRGPKTFCFQLDPETSILTLKGLIFSQIGVQPQHHRLFILRNARNFELLDLLTLNDCGVQQDENISLRLSTDGLLGGGKQAHPFPTIESVIGVLLVSTISLAAIVVWLLWRQQRGVQRRGSQKKPVKSTADERPTKGQVSDLDSHQSKKQDTGIKQQGMQPEFSEEKSCRQRRRRRSRKRKDSKIKEENSEKGGTTEEHRPVNSLEPDGTRPVMQNVSTRHDDVTAASPLGASAPLASRHGRESRHLGSADAENILKPVEAERATVGLEEAAIHYRTQLVEGYATKGTCRKETSPKCAANTNGNERIKHQTERPEPDMYEDAGEGVRKGTLSGEQGLAKEQLVGPYRSQSQKEEELGLKQHSVVKGTIPLAKKEQRQEHTRFQGNTNSKELWQSMHRGMPSLEERIHRQRQIEHLEKRHPEKKQQVQAVDSQVVLNRVILFPEDRGVKTSEQEQTGQTPADDVHRGQATTEQEGDVRGLSSCCQQMKQFPMSVQDTVSSVVQQTPSRASIDNINIYGEDSPIFCAPVYKPTLNFVQNLTVTQSCPVEEGSVASSPQKDAIQCKTELDTQKWTTAEVGRTTFGAQEAATQCRKELEERYTTTGSYVKLLPWDNRDMKHIKDMYTKLSFKNPYKSDFKQYVKKVEDIFVLKTREKQTVKRAIFCGLPGLGKSTIIGKIAYDWAVGLKILKQFTLLFVLRMSALDQTSDLLDAVFDQLLTHDTTVDKQDLKSFVYSKETSSRVLILLDGFDEFQTTTLDQSKFGSILKMLNRTVGRDWFVVVTTRPSHFADLTCKSLVEKPFTHVEVLGFGQEDIKQYVRRFYSEDVDNAEGLLDKIESSGVLSDLAKSPMLLLQMCLFWREKAQLPETLSRLYSEALRYIFRRKTPHLSENDVSEVVTDVAIVLGKTAVNGLIFPEQKLSFQETDFQKSALDKAIRAGILTSQRVIKYHGTDSNVEFIHKTFQECCAGQYCQNLLRHDAGEFQRILDEIHLRPEAFEYMLRFCCGDNEQCTKYVLNMLRKKLPDRKVAKLCLHCYFESQSTNILSYDVIDQVITEDVHIHGESNDSLNSIMWIVALISKHVSRADYLLRVHSVNISRCNLSRFSEVFASGLAGMKHLRSLHLICCELTGHNLDLMLSSIGQADLVDLIDLSLSGNQELGSSADAWAHRLRLLRNLKKLSLSYCGINSHDMAHITSSLTELAKLAVVDLSCNNNLGGCAETWAAGLKSMIHVKALEMKNCHLKGSDFKFLAEAISGMYDLRRCYFSGFGAELFISSWGNCIRLLIRASWITGEDMTDIFLSLSSWRDLFHVILHDIHLPSGSMVLWTPVFQNLTRLKRLDLNACILQSNDIEQLVAAMSQMPTLKEFTLKENRVHGLTLSKLRRFNRLGDFTSPVRARENLNNLDTMDLEGYTDTWAVCLKNLVHLRKLEWRRCDVGCRDVRHLADAVNHLDKLIYCSFSGGESKLRLCSRGTCDHASIKAKAFKRREMVDILTSLSDRKDLVSLTLRDMQGLSESLYLWTPLFQSLTNLQELSLVSCRLQSTEIEHLVTALRAMSTLRELSLKGNTSLGDAGNVWGLKLRYLGNLKKLSLSSCEITTRDMTYIALSVGEMTSLTDLDLSCNKELGGCAETWAARLKIMIHLKSLEMKNCGIRSSDVKFLAEAVGYMDNLVQWEFRGSGVELRTRSPSVHGGIRLNIVIQSMRSEDRAEIVRSLSNRRDLVSLYVRVSDGASGSLVLWAPQIQKLTNLEELHLSSHSLEKTDIEHLVGTLSRMPGLKELSLNGNRSLGGSANIWAPSLTKLVNLVHLMFCRCHLLATDIAYLSAALTELPILKEISLRGNVSLGGDAKTWAPHLLCLKSLRKLSLTSTKIRKEDMTHISFSVGKMANLTDLDLSCNKNLGNHAEIWASSMGSMVHLKRLEMKHCGITDRDVPHLVAAVSCMDNLMHCDVTGSNAKLSVWPRGSSVQSSIRDCSLSGEDMTNILQSFSGRTDLISFFLSCICGLSGSAVTWAQHLQQLTHLVKLHLINCSLQSTDIEHIAAAMNQMPTLKELSLKGNWCLGGSSTTWALSLRKMVHIVRLNLCWCGLTTGDIKHLASALSYLPILKELNLAENRSLGGDAKVWAPHLQCLKQLAKLDLTSTAVREADVGHIASSVSRMANLTHLNLSGNNDLGENAHSWAASLKDMIHLKKLEMRCCDLNCCYFKNLVEAISRMDNLTHCHFSGTKAELRMCLRGSGLRANIRACSLAGDDMADILQSFSKRMNLVSLIFEEIRGLGGSAVLWTAQLQNLTHLMELNFEASSLQSTDIEQLTATLNRMPSMKKYSLG